MIGVLALQGAFEAHRRSLAQISVSTCEVRTAADLDGCSGLVIPGGESTTISKLLVSSGLEGAIGERIKEGLPVLGTCAGAIILGSEIADGRSDQVSFGAIDIDTVRNGYGRQLQSFEAELESELLEGFMATFIRAPKISRVGPEVTVVATSHGDAVWCSQGNVMVTTFHPELGADTRIHRAFAEGLATLESKTGTAEIRGAL